MLTFSLVRKERNTGDHLAIAYYECMSPLNHQWDRCKAMAVFRMIAFNGQLLPLISDILRQMFLPFS